TIAVVATVAAGFVFPLLPLIVGTAIGLAAYRHAPTKRNVFIGLGVAVTILSIAMAALMQAHTGPVVQYVETPVTVVHH
ncbi:MAG: hypothetical protein IRZ02_06660, partial [Acidothermus sp.]|nr:hypothetical protein [Acidothermus sp.]